MTTLTPLTPASYLVTGIADQKKAEIDLLTELVNRAQYQVSQQQTIVNSLQAKADQFTAFLNQANQTKTTALSNLDLINDAFNSVANLSNATAKAQGQTDKATTTVCVGSKGVAELINKLIFAVEIINKVTQLISRQKAINPLIPSELIAFMTKAGTDANNAIALTLNALQSAYAAEASLLGAQGLNELALAQVGKLYNRMQYGWNEQAANPSSATPLLGRSKDCDGIVCLLNRAYQNSVENYNQALWNSNSVNKQLGYAQAQLVRANTRLSSYQSGLAAATAAAYAA